MTIDDIVPELLEKIKKEFSEKVEKNSNLASFQKLLENKNVTYKDANAFAIEIGEISATALEKYISEDILPDGRMYYNIGKRLLDDVLTRNYNLICDYTYDVQKLLNQQARINLKVQKPKINQDRIDGFVNRLDSEESFNDVKWLLDDPIVNFSQSIVDDFIELNAKFHAKAGLSPKLIRTTESKPCKWCSEIAGTYDYPAPSDIYKRHEHCRCIVEYNPKNGKLQNVWAKKWYKETTDVIERRKQINIAIKDNNRKSDIKEYKEIVSILGTKAPISLAKFQDLKYNEDDTGYERLKDKAYIQGNFKKGIWLDKINPEKQARHIQSTAGEDKSYFSDDADVNMIYNKYKMSGYITKSQGNRTQFEKVNLDEEDCQGVDTFSGHKINAMTIHYSKTGVHLVPTYYERRP